MDAIEIWLGELKCMSRWLSDSDAIWFCEYINSVFQNIDLKFLCESETLQVSVSFFIQKRQNLSPVF